MDLQTWLARQESEVQLDFFRQTAEFLSNGELLMVMKELKKGGTLLEAYVKLGFLARYQVDFARIRNRNF